MATEKSLHRDILRLVDPRFISFLPPMPLSVASLLGSNAFPRWLSARQLADQAREGIAVEDGGGITADKSLAEFVIVL